MEGITLSKSAKRRANKKVKAAAGAEVALSAVVPEAAPAPVAVAAPAAAPAKVKSPKAEPKAAPAKVKSPKAEPKAAPKKVSAGIPIEGYAGTVHERTFIAIKPDGVQRGKVGAIIARFEDKGFKLVAMKELSPTKEMAATHYSDLSKKGFFKGLCEYFASGTIVAMVWEGKNAILTGRVILGQTNPADSAPGSLRGDMCIDVGRNICHGSDGPEGAKTEINYWFNAGEICNWNSSNTQWVYEDVKPNVREEKTEKTGKHHCSKNALPPAGVAGKNSERTFIAIKPDGVQRGKIGNIVARFENKGFVLVAFKMIWPTKEMAAAHYADLSKKGFFKGLCEYFSMGPIVAMVWEGKNAIKSGRVLLGETDPAKSSPGTIRGDLCIEVGRNICHGSDGPESAAHEIGFWFAPQEITDWTPANSKWVYE